MSVFSLYRVLLLSSVLAGAAASLFLPTTPLLAYWLVCALGFGGFLSFNASPNGLQQRTARIALLYVVLFPASLLTTQLSAARRSSATHLRVHGVLVEGRDTVAIGSGVGGVDVTLPMSASVQSPWSLRVAHVGTRWVIAATTDVEQLRLSPAPIALKLGRNAFMAPFGTVLRDSTERALLHDRSGRVLDTLSLQSGAHGLAVHSATLGDYYLEPVEARLNARFRRMLSSGTSLATLDAGSANRQDVGIPLERFVRVQEVQRSQQVNRADNTSRLHLPWDHTNTRRFLVTALSPFSISPLAGNADAAALQLGDSTRVEVRQGNGVWKFDVVKMRRSNAAPEALAIRFVRNPRVLDFAMPGAGTCAANVACGLISLRPLPAPIAHIVLADAGPDTSRFALLANARETDDGLVLGLPQQEVTVPRGGGVALVPVSSRRLEDGVKIATPGTSSEWLMVSATASRFNTLARMAAVALGLIALLLIVYELADTTGTATVRATGANERSLALGLNAILALIMTRIIVGARVALFAPYKDAGLDTAIGLTVAIAGVSVGLLLWQWWVPWLLNRLNILFSYPRAEWRAQRLALTPPKVVRRPRRAKSVVQKRVILMVASVGAIGCLLFASVGAVLKGLMAGGAVLSIWMLLAWVSAFGSGAVRKIAARASDVIEFDEDEASDVQTTGVPSQSLWPNVSGPNGQIALLCAVWALTLKVPLLGLGVAASVALVVAIRAVFNRRASPGSARRVLLNVILQFSSVAMLAALRLQSENGAMATFLLVIMVTLLSVRFGRALAGRLARSTASAIGWPMIAIYLSLPLAVLGLSLAVIDMGLLLVMIIPIGAASLLAVGWRAIGVGGKVFAGALALVIGWVLVIKVLFPSTGAIGVATASANERAAAFEHMYQLPRWFSDDISNSLARAAARAVATTDQLAAERLLLAARPGMARDLLLPSIEQAWGGRVYSASGLIGHGLGTAPIGGHGIAEAVSYAENSFAVYVLYENGALGGVMVLLTYVSFMCAMMWTVYSTTRVRNRGATDPAAFRASRSLFLVSALLVTIPAAYVALSNVGIVPITGQNMPFLGLNSWSDVTLCAGIIGMLLTGAIRTQGVQRSST